jgi:hypothetical protein
MGVGEAGCTVGYVCAWLGVYRERGMNIYKFL